MENERLAILKMLEAGQIGADEAAKLLSALDQVEHAPAEAAQGDDLGAEQRDVETVPLVSEQAVIHQSRWARFWIYPLMAGGAGLILGSLVMALVYGTEAARGWLVCGWLPMILGLLVMLLAWWSRNAKWLHVRIHDDRKRRIAISIPLPLTFAAWVLRLIQPLVPQLRDTGVDDMIIALRDSGSDEPISIDVRDGKDGEHVQVYVG